MAPQERGIGTNEQSVFDAVNKRESDRVSTFRVPWFLRIAQRSAFHVESECPTILPRD